MKLLYKKSFVFILAGMAYLVGQYFRGVWFNPSWPVPCRKIISGTMTYCYAPHLNTLGWPLIMLGQYLAIIGIIMLLTNANIFRKWLKFSMYYVPVATALTFWMYPTTTPLGGVVPISQGVYLFGRLYIFITASIVLVAWIRVFWKRHLKSDLNK